jgi:hypothetical protein
MGSEIGHILCIFPGPYRYFLTVIKVPFLLLKFRAKLGWASD